MMHTWNIGNTTVRNPQRIAPALAVLRDGFEGRDWDAKAEEDYLEALVEAGVYAPTGKRTVGTTRGQGGRKWVSAFNQLGFARAWRRSGPVEITAPGRVLLASDEPGQQEVFLRQLLKYRTCSPIESDSRYELLRLRPFWLFLRVLAELDSGGMLGLSKEEIALFLVTNTDGANPEDVVERIIAYRAVRDSITGLVGKRRHFAEARSHMIAHAYAEDLEARREALREFSLQFAGGDSLHDEGRPKQLLDSIVASGKSSRSKRAERLRGRVVDGLANGVPLAELAGIVEADFVSTRGGKLVDYADTAIRYFSMSGLFALAGSRVIIRDSYRSLVEGLLAGGEPPYQEASYLEELYTAASPVLPTDNLHFLQESLSEMRRMLGEAPGRVAEESASVITLRGELKRLRGELIRKREKEFYRRQSHEIDEIDDFFQQIADNTLLGGDAYRPAFFEWAIWRVFLAVNELTCDVSDTRGFRIDEELYPVHHAAAGSADMLFEYACGTMVVEATLSTGENQWSQEQEPVQRHVKNVMASRPGRTVIGIFVAPAVHPSTAVNFRQARGWIEGQGEVQLDILPITDGQLRTILQRYRSRPFTSDTMYREFQRLLAARWDVDDGVAWLDAIEASVREGDFLETV